MVFLTMCEQTVHYVKPYAYFVMSTILLQGYHKPTCGSEHATCERIPIISSILFFSPRFLKADENVSKT
ncbi:hypothetical protein Pan97_46060 [Bremerella volcania]|uniref:Uncharacterized protein n=1 Tax=Bremerella volcania TaxID=2527984 RepID=A0A518CE72_9BACT|nr:hypothetical protein Pan97_46060 [Bremerella volcania]